MTLEELAVAPLRDLSSATSISFPRLLDLQLSAFRELREAPPGPNSGREKYADTARRQEAQDSQAEGWPYSSRGEDLADPGPSGPFS